MIVNLARGGGQASNVRVKWQMDGLEISYQALSFALENMQSLTFFTGFKPALVVF